MRKSDDLDLILHALSTVLTPTCIECRPNITRKLHPSRVSIVKVGTCNFHDFLSERRELLDEQKAFSTRDVVGR